MEHSHTHSHTHLHDPAETKRQINRISRMIGHLEHIRKMIAANEDCTDVLIQLSAVKSALSGLGKEIIKEHQPLHRACGGGKGYGDDQRIHDRHAEIY